jgi:hypothetical protein
MADKLVSLRRPGMLGLWYCIHLQATAGTWTRQGERDTVRRRAVVTHVDFAGRRSRDRRIGIDARDGNDAVRQRLFQAHRGRLSARLRRHIRAGRCSFGLVPRATGEECGAGDQPSASHLHAPAWPSHAQEMRKERP